MRQVRGLRRTLLGAAMLAFLGAVPIVAAPPAAAIAGLVRVAATSPLSSVDKTVPVACPVGTVATGAGAYLAAGSPTGEIGFTEIRPVIGGSGVLVTAREADNDLPSNWQVNAVALCAPPPTGLVYAEASSPAGSTPTRSVTLSCPAGRLIGAGGRIGNGSDNVFLTAITPNTALNAVTVEGTETEAGTGGFWHVTATVVCAKEPAGLELASAKTAATSASYDSTLGICPSGKEMYGTGFSINNGNGEVLLHGLNVTPTTTIRLAGAEDATGYNGTWTMSHHAICAF